MEILQKTLTLDREGLCLKHVELSNILLGLGLTAGETRVLAAIAAMGGRLGAGERAALARGLGIGASAVGNHLQALLGKGVLEMAVGGGFSVKGFLVPGKGGQGYRVRLAEVT